MNQNNRAIAVIQVLFAIYIISISTAFGEQSDSPAIEITYPQKYAIVQRDANNSGEIQIDGRCQFQSEQIEARFNQQEWALLSACSAEKTFNGKILGKVGQGFLQVRYKFKKNYTAVVPMISIGDIFLVAGQSNASGFATTLYAPDKKLRFQLIMFKNENRSGWKPLRDPTSGADYPLKKRRGSAWPLTFSQVSKKAKVPIGLINAASAGSWILQWQKSRNELYRELLQSVSAATHGAMKVNAILWFQGEADCNPAPKYSQLSLNGNYELYKRELSNLVTDLKNDISFNKFYVGVIGNVPHSIEGEVVSTRENNVQIRRALQDSWEDSRISAGPLTYDILLRTDPLHIHFNSLNEMSPLASRWAAAILAGSYGIGKGRGPKLLKVGMNRLKNQITLTFDEPLVISDYRGRLGSKAEGWSISYETAPIAEPSILSTEIINQTVLINLNISLPDNARISYAIDNDGAGKMILRGRIGLPIEPFIEQFLVVKN